MNSETDIVRDIQASQQRHTYASWLKSFVTGVVTALRRATDRQVVTVGRTDLRPFTGGTEAELMAKRDDFESLLSEKLGHRDARRVHTFWQIDRLTRQPVGLKVFLRDNA